MLVLNQDPGGVDCLVSFQPAAGKRLASDFDFCSHLMSRFRGSASYRQIGWRSEMRCACSRSGSVFRPVDGAFLACDSRHSRCASVQSVFWSSRCAWRCWSAPSGCKRGGKRTNSRERGWIPWLQRLPLRAALALRTPHKSPSSLLLRATGCSARLPAKSPTTTNPPSSAIRSNKRARNTVSQQRCRSAAISQANSQSGSAPLRRCGLQASSSDGGPSYHVASPRDRSAKGLTLPSPCLLSPESLSVLALVRVCHDTSLLLPSSDRTTPYRDPSAETSMLLFSMPCIFRLTRVWHDMLEGLGQGNVFPRHDTASLGASAAGQDRMMTAG